MDEEAEGTADEVAGGAKEKEEGVAATEVDDTIVEVVDWVGLVDGKNVFPMAAAWNAANPSPGLMANTMPC